MRRLACFSLLLLAPLVAPLSGCGPGRGRYGSPAHHAERATVAGTEVSDDAFAAAVRDLLASEPNSRERQLRLQGVVGRQMVRVATRFKSKDRERAVASLQGAMYLVHAGELKTEMLGSQGHEALRAASEEFAKQGDEGRARATYEMLMRISPPAEKGEIKSHLDAISAWTKDTAGGGVMQTAGALEAAAVTRHLLEPSTEARDEAIARTQEFVEKAAAVRTARRARGTQVTREEGLEAVRALETGATVLAAIHLRNADPQGALGAIDKVRDVARPELLRALEAVVEKPESDRWLELARMLRPPPRQAHSEEEDFGRDAELLRVASFAAAAEAYRLDSTSPEPAAFVAAMLVDLGMGEAAPAILVDAVKAQKDPRIVGLSLAITMQAMGRGLEAEEPDTVRRTFRAAAPILAIADEQAHDQKKGAQPPSQLPQPPPSRVYGMMGEIEIREGRLDEARKLLTASVEREKAGSVLLSLARLDWHDGQMKVADSRIKEALAADDVVKDPALRGEVLLLQSDITREQGDANGARKPLSDALRDLAKARSGAEGDDRARIERLIARALDRFGDSGARSSAMKALDRALEASPRDKHQAAATIGQIVGRAFVKGDLAGARDGLARGVGAELPREDLVYYAMWVRVLERQQKATGESLADKVLVEGSTDPRWIGRVAAFGAGKLKAQDLVAAAQTPTQKTEALFYTAMDRRVAGDAKGADEGLKQVIASPGLDLMEVALARELLSGARGQIGGPVPEVGLP
jgi:tetratricopeptide (TPR) repeat protein